MPTFVDGRAVGAKILPGQCHMDCSVTCEGSVSRRGQCFVTGRNYPGVVLPGPRGGGNGAANVDSHDVRRVAQMSGYPLLHGK